MVRSSISGLQGELVIERDVINVSYLSDIDANWRYTDTRGHHHYCDYDAPDHYPTLREVTDQTWWCDDCRDEHEDTHLECRQCGEHITPGMTGPGTKLIPGRVEYTFNGEPVTPERAQQIIENWRPSG